MQRALTVCAALVALLAVVAVPAPSPLVAAAAPFQYYPGVPQGTVGVAEPTISDGIVLNGIRPSQVTFTMALNGKPVKATMDPDGSRIAYRPPSPLAAGTYQVALHINAGGWYADVHWSFQIRRSPLGVLPPPGAADAFALRWVDTYRALAGLPAIHASDALAASAWAHTAFYLANESRYGSQITLSVHKETSGWSGFTGTGPAQRAAYFGFGYGGVSEDMSFGSGIASAIDGWMDSVYHRFAITDPLARLAGFAIGGNSLSDPNQPVTDLEVGEAGNGPAYPTVSVTYPAPGQQGVEESFPAGEVPDPLSAFADASYPAGYPITLQFGSVDATSVQVTSATLSAGGAAVPFWLLDAGTVPPSAAGNAAVDEMGANVALIPKKPLAPATLYQVHVAGSVTDAAGTQHPFARDWSFTTSPFVDPGNLSSADAGSGRIALTTEGNSSRADVYVGGYPVVDLTHSDAHTLQFSVPAGLGSSADLYVVQPDGQEESWPQFVGSNGGWTSPAGTPPGRITAGVLQIGNARLIPLGQVEAAGARATTIEATGTVVLDNRHGTVVGAFRVNDPVGYRRSAAGLLSRVVFTNPPLRRGGTVFIPRALAVAAGYSGAGSVVSYAPAGYSGPQTLTLNIGSSRYTADGVAGNWPAGLGAPYVSAAGRTMLPVRALAYVLGLKPGDITWYGPGHALDIPPVEEVDISTPWGTTITITPDQILRTGSAGSTAPVLIPLDVTGLKIINGRSFVPFRALGYAFGLDSRQIAWTADPVTELVATVSFSWRSAP